MLDTINEAKRLLKLSIIRKNIMHVIEDKILYSSTKGYGYTLFLFPNTDEDVNDCMLYVKEVANDFDFCPMIILPKPDMLSDREFDRIYNEIICEIMKYKEEFDVITTEDKSLICDDILIEDEFLDDLKPLNFERINWIYLDWYIVDEIDIDNLPYTP